LDEMENKRKGSRNIMSAKVCYNKPLKRVTKEVHHDVKKVNRSLRERKIVIRKIKARGYYDQSIDLYKKKSQRVERRKKKMIRA